MTAAGGSAHQIARSAAFQLVARIGLAAYGVVHLLVAWLAVRVATGAGGGRADKGGALQTVASGAGGRWALWLIAIGLGASALWQLYEALFGHPTVRGRQRILLRGTNVAEAIVFGYLAYSAGQIAAGGNAASTDQAQRGLVGTLLAEPYGKVAVVALGAGVVAVAGFVARHGLRRRFARDLDLAPASLRQRRIVLRLGQGGYLSLGAAYGIAGILVIVAALRSEPAKATGLDAALKTLAEQRYGPALLVIVALGLAAFGVYTLFDARYRRTG